MNVFANYIEMQHLLVTSYCIFGEGCHASGQHKTLEVSRKLQRLQCTARGEIIAIAR